MMGNDDVVILTLCILLGIIPGVMAHQKGRNFFLWWLYGAAIFIVAIVHVILLKPLPQDEPLVKPTPMTPTSEADAIEKFAKLREQGFLTEAEFNAKKAQLLGLAPEPPLGAGVLPHAG